MSTEMGRGKKKRSEITNDRNYVYWVRYKGNMRT